MSMLQRFASHREPSKEAQLAKQVTVLQGTLAKCKELAMRWRRLRVALIGTIAVIMLGLGFVLGIYEQPIRHSVARLTFKPTQPNADAGYAAYQKGDYATALRILRPLAEEGDARSIQCRGHVLRRSGSAAGLCRSRELVPAQPRSFRLRISSAAAPPSRTAIPLQAE